MPLSVPEPVLALWRRFEPWFGPVALVAGFTWDALTLRRIDRLADNALLLVYLLVLGALLVAERRVALGHVVPERLKQRATWLHLGVQFFFGSLFSAYVIFFAKSAMPGRGLLFLGVLVALLLVNELVDHVLHFEVMRSLLYFFSAWAFFSFSWPVVTGSISPLVGGLAAGSALALATLVWAAVHAFPDGRHQGWRGGERPVHRRLPGALGLHVGGWFATLWLLVCLGWLDVVPPVPLGLQTAGVFHRVERQREGYALTFERRPIREGWYGYDRRFRLRPGDAAHCFSAVFAPSGMAIEVWHVWQWWDPKARAWVDRDRLKYRMEGGRDGGYRGWTKKRALQPGSWRVRIESERGRALGRVDFEIVPDDGSAIDWQTVVY